MRAYWLWLSVLLFVCPAELAAQKSDTLQPIEKKNTPSKLQRYYQ
jgi:hypothetical protein